MCGLMVYNAKIFPSTRPDVPLAETCSSSNFSSSALYFCGHIVSGTPSKWESMQKHHPLLYPCPPPTRVCHPPKTLSTRIPEGRPPFHESTDFLHSSKHGLHLCCHGGLGTPEDTAPQQYPGPQITNEWIRPSSCQSQVLFCSLML